MVGRRRDVVGGRRRWNAPCIPTAAIHARCIHVPAIGQWRGGAEEGQEETWESGGAARIVGGVAAAARIWQRDGDDTPRPRVFAGGRHWRDGASMGRGASA
jgi:hypothetical protein